MMINKKNPQLEDGYIRIANEIFDALICYRIAGEQRQVLDFIIRKTYGFNKKRDKIPISQFHKATGIKKSNVIRAINSLVDKNIVLKNETSYITSYCFNKVYSTWKPVSKKRLCLKNETTPVSKMRHKPVSILRHSKDKRQYTKDRESLSKKITYLKNIPDTDLESFFTIIYASREEIKRKADDLYDYCQAKGRRYKNYKAFLRNALKKDFGLRKRGGKL